MKAYKDYMDRIRLTDAQHAALLAAVKAKEEELAEKEPAPAMPERLPQKGSKILRFRKLVPAAVAVAGVALVILVGAPLLSDKNLSAPNHQVMTSGEKNVEDLATEYPLEPGKPMQNAPEAVLTPGPDNGNSPKTAGPAADPAEDPAVPDSPAAAGNEGTEIWTREASYTYSGNTAAYMVTRELTVLPEPLTQRELEAFLSELSWEKVRGVLPAEPQGLSAFEWNDQNYLIDTVTGILWDTGRDLMASLNEEEQETLLSFLTGKH